MGFGQGWEKTFGGSSYDVGSSVQQTTDGGYIVCGLINNSDIYLVKVDANGLEQWNNIFGGIDVEWGYSVQQTTDGGYIITGKTRSFGTLINYNIYLIKTDGNGIEQWSATYNNSSSNSAVGLSVQQTTDGGYIICGSLGQPDYGYLLKLDGNGIEQWSQIFGDMLFSVQQTTDGGYIACGYNNEDVYLVKTDMNGIEQWNQSIGGSLDEWGHSVQQTTDGGYIIVGYTRSFGSSMEDIYLIKTDGNGVEQWNQTFGGTGSDVGHSVQQTTNGEYVIVGCVDCFENGSDIYLMRTDANGNELWNNRLGGTGKGVGYSVQQTTDGGYIITGTTNYSEIDADISLIKTDGNGNITSEFTIPLNSERELNSVLDLLGRDINPAKNKPFIEIYNDGTVEKKIIIE